MADAVNFRIDGIDDLKRQIEKITREMGPDNVEKVNYDAADIITREVQSRAPQGPTGNLKSSPVTKKLKREYYGHPARAIAAIDRKKAPHAHLVEYGTSSRREVKDKQVLYDSKTGKFFGKSVGPMTARPFFRPAVDAKYNEAFDFLKNGLGDLIDRGVR